MRLGTPEQLIAWKDDLRALITRQTRVIDLLIHALNEPKSNLIERPAEVTRQHR